MLLDRLKYYHQFEQLLNPKNRLWWQCELIMITIQTGRFLFYVLLSFMGESVLRSYCPYDTTAAPLFDYFNHLNNGTPLNLIDCRLTLIILTIFLIFILHSQYMLFLNDHNSITWCLLYDISNRNYDHYRNSIVHVQNVDMIKTVIRTFNNCYEFNESMLNSSPRIIHDCLARILKKNPKNFIDKLIIQLMLDIDIYKFEKLQLQVFSYAGLKQRMALVMTMFLLNCLDVFLFILVISTTLNFACLKYFNFIRIHMWNLWPLALFDCINHIYSGYMLIRNCTLYFNFSTIGFVFYSSQMNSLNKKLRKIFENSRHMINSRLNYLRLMVWRQFQRQHQHMTYCIMYSGHDV
ncbi:uncharacterized protein LOC113794952 [Dermatophagoides pteronyssinus]|uniref:uncharacterized protein LOC113794952 n=1 Tax=Dermatophagoides pteronyssinus TaxID=6956 RepID=UPI003F66D2C8